MHITSFGEKNFPLDYFVSHKHDRMLSCKIIFVLYYCIYREHTSVPAATLFSKVTRGFVIQNTVGSLKNKVKYSITYRGSYSRDNFICNFFI